MSKLLSVAVLGLALSFGAAHAQDAKKPTAQQSKMGVCNKEAGEKKGDERKAFMSECLKNKPVATTQQDKMKVCNTSAKDMKGDERKAFMSECLKKKA
ncbi:MAG TPA: PsiF family protein [Ramlibacter sp.]|nr:PsiF family protein [Ramlibacter sp.]